MSALTLAERALQIAVSQKGVCENPKGSNTGKEVNQYLKSVGLGPGNAWCMAFVYWCVQKAATELGAKNPLIRTGGVMLQWTKTTCKTRPRTDRNVKPGDIFIVDCGGGLGHTGFVLKVENGVIHTIEGNTNDDGSREGYEVAIRTRPLGNLKGFIVLNS